jgi:hypothetical protein
MSTRPAVSLQNLGLASAGLLTSREALWVCRPYLGAPSFTQLGYGNTAQAGLLNVPIANGSFTNILSLGSGNIG